MSERDEHQRLRDVGMQNAQSILLARQRAEQELRATKEALEDEKRILELLNATGAKLASNLDHQKLLQMVTDAGTELSGADFGAFFYTTEGPDGELFHLYTLSGAPREAFEKLGHPRSTPIFGPTFRGERVVRSDDIQNDPDYGRWAPHFGMPEGHLPVRSYLAVPVASRSGGVIGGLFFGHREVGVFTERTERIIVGVAAQAAIALDNARLFEEVRRSAEARARLLDAEREARAEVERISLMKDEFLATLSHELRTPLNAMLGWSEILLHKADADPELRRGVETIARNARAQARLIDDLLDMNRIVSGKVRLDVQLVDPATIIEAALESVRPSAEAKSIELREDLETSVGPLFGDPNRLQQVVWNLLSNAVKFTPRGGAIEVSLARAEDDVRIEVRDTGIGIDPEFLPQLFERFRQADSSITRRHGGLGLGLSIVKSLVELHGGSVAAASEGPERGATFTVTLPLRAVVDEASAELPTIVEPVVEAEPAPDALAGLEILIVDDEPDALDLAERILVMARASVRTARSADEALRSIAEAKPDLLVSDIGMPDKDGFELLRELRARPDGGQIPAVALTALAQAGDHQRALDAGYQEHLTKPIDPRRLIAAISRVLGRVAGD